MPKKNIELKNIELKTIEIPVSFEIINSDGIDFNKIEAIGGELGKALAAKKVEKDKDLMYVKFRYVHEGSNANKDSFVAEDLKERHSTAIFKPINMNHTNSNIIGTLYDSEFIDKEKSDIGKAGVNVYGVVYKWLFPEVANELKKRYDEGKLVMSMEVWYDKVICSVCNKEFEKADDYCDHLKNRHSTADTQRILKGITFGGAGIVDNPADKDAVALSVAQKGDFVKYVEKNEEVKKFESILNNAVNYFYNMYYEGQSVKADKREFKDRINAFIEEFKSMLDNININKIVKGDKIVSEVTYNQETVDALISAKEKEISDKFVADTENIKADFSAQIENLNKELEMLKADKVKAETDFNAFKQDIVNKQTLVNRRKILADKKVEIANDEKTDNMLIAMDEEMFNLFVSAKYKVEITVANDQNADATPTINDADKQKIEALNVLKSALDKI